MKNLFVLRLGRVVLVLSYISMHRRFMLWSYSERLGYRQLVSL